MAHSALTATGAWAKVVSDGHVRQLRGRAQSVIEEPARAKAHCTPRVAPPRSRTTPRSRQGRFCSKSRSRAEGRHGAAPPVRAPASPARSARL
mgnify:CR=1 FL=1